MRTFEESLRNYEVMVKQDFENTIRNFEKNEFELRENRSFKKLHTWLFSLFSLIEEIHNTSDNDLPLLNEVRSDLIELISTLSYGLKRSSFLCMRSSVEHLFLHIYYKDHPIEYLQFQKTKHRLTFEELSRYVLHYPYFRKADKIINTIINEYKKKSELIHAASSDTFQNMRMIDEAKMSSNDTNLILRDSLKIVECIKILIIILHKDNFDLFDVEKRRFFVYQIQKRNRTIINSINN